MPAPPAKDVLAAGVVAFRPGRRVLLVHRPKYDDWSFPKGKLDRGEHRVAAAVREVAEETGLHVRLCLPLPDQRYPVGHGRKTVHYWTGRVVGDPDVSGYRPNDEIDAVRWVEADEAADLLTYERDRTTLAAAVRRRRRTGAVVVLRHGPARSRRAWRRDDAERPLLRLGEHQALRLVPLLAAYGVTRVLSSSSRRCVQTVEPFASTTGWDLETRRRLSEEHASRPGVARVVDDLVTGLAEHAGAVVCTHRPVLPHVFDALGLDDPHLETGEMFVAHLRKGRVVASERHLPA
ncbi:NUDIX hydrolase [Nocardioides litoris]|uniref:NUDIX hydrolase n=1 Tax=Nocardioides litoris TaxID=1926648 RepID=UPI0011243766|nr:NUDIX hydrolase [Nocardioides litoris]